MRIVLVGPLSSRFVHNDVLEIRKDHEVITFNGNIGKGAVALFNLAILNIKLIWSLFFSDAILFWFADYYSGLPSIFAKVLRKKIFVIAGGFDIWYLPELNVGAKTRPFRWINVKICFQLATRIFPVSNYAKGLLDKIVPDHGPSTVIYSAVEGNLFQCSNQNKEPIALTVTQVDTVNEYIRKGIDVFIKVAPLLPHVSFQVAGIRGEAYQQSLKDSNGISNVEIIPAPISSPDLSNIYCKASVYCQLSIDETFGLAIAEAMNCGCVPVVSEPPVFKEVIGDCGYVAHRSNLEEIASKIQLALAATERERQQCKQRASQFDLSVRSKRLREWLR